MTTDTSKSKAFWNKLWDKHFDAGEAVFFCAKCETLFTLKRSVVKQITRRHPISLYPLQDIIECCENPSIYYMTGDYHPEKYKPKPFEELLSKTTKVWLKVFGIWDG